MDTTPIRVPRLVPSSSDDSFELIDPEFDESYYQELRGVAVADFIPLESGEILLRKGTTSLRFVSYICWWNIPSG